MTALTDFLLARIAEDEEIAQAAVTPERPGMHWRWERTLDDRVVSEPSWEDMPVSLRSVEQFPSTSGVGALPDFPVDHLEADEARALPHIARHDPARVLAECEAKRRIVSRCDMVLRGREHGMFNGGQEVDANDNLRALAQVYADHPDYQPEWSLGD